MHVSLPTRLPSLLRWARINWYYEKDRNSNPVALVPILVFLVLYLGTGIIFEYVMKIPMGFYNVPIIVAFMAAILVACMQNSQLKFDEKLDVMAKGWLTGTLLQCF